MENVNRIGDGSHVDHPEFSGPVRNPDFTDTAPHRRHGFPVDRIAPFLDARQFAACVMAYGFGKLPQAG